MWHQLIRKIACIFHMSENKMRTYYGLKLQRGELLTTILTDQETNSLKPQQALFTLCRKKKKCCSLDTSGTFPQCHRFVILEALHF